MWSKIDDNVPDHPKFVRAGAVASWLWVCGNCYANRLLTDGFIPAEKVPSLGTVQRPQDAARILVEVGLWEEVEGGFQVHDFHDHNPRAEDVKRKRESDRLRKMSTRIPRRIQRESARIPEVDPNPNPNPNPHTDTAKAKVSAAQPSNGNGHGALSVVVDPETAEEALRLRAGALVERYKELFHLHRRGARYHSRPALDFPRALNLVRTWPDDTRLEKIAVIIITTDDEWITGTDRGFGVFEAKASWADDRLSAWEADHGLKEH